MYICIYIHTHNSLSSFIHSSMRNKANTQLRYYAFCLHGKCKSLTSLFQKEAFLSHTDSGKLHSSKDECDSDGEKLCVVLVIHVGDGELLLQLLNTLDTKTFAD